jgi:hypothetical protein
MNEPGRYKRCATAEPLPPANRFGLKSLSQEAGRLSREVSGYRSRIGPIRFTIRNIGDLA